MRDSTLKRIKTKADAPATSLYESARIDLPYHRLRTDYIDGAPDFYILRQALYPAVLIRKPLYGQF